MITALEQRLQGTLFGRILQDFLTNSCHFPLANIIFELLRESPWKYLHEPDLYTILLAGIIQSFCIGSWNYKGISRPFLGNLIAPGIYTVIETAIEGVNFFDSPNHLAYWGFSLTIALLQSANMHSTHSGVKDILTVSEHFIRTCILLVMYWIFECLAHPEYRDIGKFFADSSHVYVAIVIPLLGLVVGFNNLSAQRYQVTLHATALELKKYSEWLLGKNLLARAISDSRTLNLQRQKRAVFFIDIRGFTNWSETKTPEQVVSMLNAYFDLAEKAWESTDVLKTKHTGDEIMAVFKSPQEAVDAALLMLAETAHLLARYGLSAGTGIHYGELVEGLIGSGKIKIYDIIGDTVNTAKRICDQAAGGELLISAQVIRDCADTTRILSSRSISMKGKSEPLLVYSIAPE